MRKKHIKEWGETLSGPRPAGMPPENQPSYSWSPSQPRPMEFGRSDLSDSRAIDNINNSLDRALDTYYLTPYIALERIRKVLAPFGIVVPAVVFMNSDGGSRVFPISQWGGIYGTTGKAFDPMNPVDTNIEVNPEYNLYYTWAYDRTRKVYNVYARIVNTEKLSELLAMNEESEKPHPKGTRVVVAHKGHQKPGRVIRHDKGGPDSSPFYIVDVGEYGSHKFMAHQVKKEDFQEDNLQEVSAKLAQKVFSKRERQYQDSKRTLPQGSHLWSGTMRREKGKPRLYFGSGHPKTDELLGKANKAHEMLIRRREREQKKVNEATIFKFPGSKKKPAAPSNKYAGTWEGGKEPHTPPAGDPRVDKTALRAREYYKKHGRMPPDLA